MRGWEEKGFGEDQTKISEGTLCVYLSGGGEIAIYLKLLGMLQGYVRYDSLYGIKSNGRAIEKLTLRYQYKILNELDESEQMKGLFSLLNSRDV